MSWSLIREASDLLLTKKFISDLEVRLTNNETFLSKNNRKSWLSSSIYILNNIEKKVVGKKVQKELLISVYYLRCLFFWKTNDMKNLGDELKNVIFERFYNEDIFNFIQGMWYLNLSLIELRKEKMNKQELKDNLESAYIYLKDAEKAKSSKELISAISWSKAWMYQISGQDEKANEEIKKAKRQDKFKLDQGWLFWIQWFGSKLKENEMIKLLGDK